MKTLAILLAACGLTCVPALAQSPPASFSRTITYQGESVTVDYVAHPVRSPNFQVLVQDASGALVPHTPAPSRIYLGTVQGRPGAMAAGLLKADDTLITRITFITGVEWLAEGSSVSQRGTTNWTPAWPGYLPGSGGAGSNVFACEVGIDSPHDHFLASGGTVDDTVEISEFSVMATNLLYLRDAAIVHRVGRVIVRTDPTQDPYESIGGNAGGLLTEVRNQWNNVLPASTHDLALVARRGVGGGVAWVNAVGTGNRYSANGCSSIGEFTVVWRHEAGHNWGLGHYDGGAPEGPTINSSNTLGRMSSPELKKALDHRDSRGGGVLDNLGPYPFPIPPRASADRASFEPDGSTVLLDVLDNDSDSNGEAISILSFDLTTNRGGSVQLSAGTGPGGRDELLYAPPADLLDGIDHFSYRIADTAGREALGYVVLQPEFRSDLVAHWNFDEGAGPTARDATAAGRDASISGTPGWTASGKEDAALVINGVDNPAQAPSLNFESNTVTFSAWIRRDGDQNDWAGILFSRGGGATGLNFGNNNELRYHWDGGGNSSYNFNSGLVPPDGVWTFVALVVSPTRATIYMRPEGGSLQSANNFGSFAVNSISGDFWLGRDPNSSSRTFTGAIDEARVLALALDSAEIAALADGAGSASAPSPSIGGAVQLPQGQDLAWKSPPATASSDVYLGTGYAAVLTATPASPEFIGNVATGSITPPALSEGTWFWRVDTRSGASLFPGPIWYFTASPDLIDGLVGWWKMDDGAGQIALDSSSSGADGTLDLPDWAPGIRGDALQFDGNDRVECGSEASLDGTTPFTVAAWIRVPSGPTNTGVIIQQRDSGGFNGQYQLRIRTDGRLNFWCYGDLSTQFEFQSVSAVNDGQWHHVAASRDDLGSAAIYIDGVLENSVSGTTVRPLSGSIGVGIGCDIRDSNKFFTGTIDDVRIYSRELPQAEVGEVMNRPPYFTANPISGPDGLEGEAYSATVAGSATDLDDGETLSYEKLSGPDWMIVAPDGSLSGTPGAADVGDNLFQIRASDVVGADDTATLTISIANQNDPPSFSAGLLLASDATEDLAYSGSITDEASDTDPGDSLSFEKISGPAWLVIDPAGNLSGTPGNAEVGSQDFEVRVSDSFGAFDTATLRIVVINVNDPPVFASDPVVVPPATEDLLYSGSIAGSASDVDAGDTLEYAKTSGPAWLTIAPDGSLSGTPGDADGGSNQFGIRAIDAAGASADAILQIEVQPVDDPPTFASDPIFAANASEDSPYSGSLAGAIIDPDGGEVIFLKNGGPAWLSVGPDGELSGTPSDQDLGLNVFEVAITHPLALFYETASLQIEVIAVNDPPAFTEDPITRGPITEDEAFTGQTLAGTAVDPDAGDTLSYSKLSGPAWLLVAPDGALSGTPPAGSAGSNLFAVRVADVAGESATASLQIEVLEAGLPLPWEELSIGGLAGSAEHSVGEFTLTGAGTLRGKEDAFHFVSQPVEGDAEIIARIASVGDTSADARAGIMIRDTLGAGSRHMFLGLNGQGDIRWVRRTSADGGTSTSKSGSGTPDGTWVRIVREADRLTAYKSADGSTWIPLGSLSAFLPSTCYFGLAVASGSDAVGAPAVFTDLSVTP